MLINSVKHLWIIKGLHVVGDKAKWSILKRVFQENKARQIFRKTNISYPLIRPNTCEEIGTGRVKTFVVLDLNTVSQLE